MAGDDVGRIAREDLNPHPRTLERISASLDSRRLVGTRLLVQPPDYTWLTAVVSLSARPRFDRGEVRTQVLRALYRLYHPLYGGPDGTGWPFGRSVRIAPARCTPSWPGSQAWTCRGRCGSGCPAEADTGRRGETVHRLDLPETGLVYSFEHQVRVNR